MTGREEEEKRREREGEVAGIWESSATSPAQCRRENAEKEKVGICG